MLPTTGQGGSQSLEDVCALGILFSNLNAKSDVADRLKIMEKLRKERSISIQSISGLVFGTEEAFGKAKPQHRIHSLGIKSPEDHMKFIYG